MGNLQRVSPPFFADPAKQSSTNTSKVVMICPPVSDSTCLCELARKASRSASQLYDLVLAPVGLKSSQFILLRAIAEAKEIAQWRLSRELGVAVETLTRRLATLRRSKWVELRMGTDRREHLYTITDLGESQLERARPYWNRAEQRLHDQLGDSGSREIRRSLDRLAQAALLSLSARRKNTIPRADGE